MNKDTINRFVRDCNLPINIFTEPHFSYFLDLYEPSHGSRTKFEQFKKEVEKFPSESDFLENYYNIRDKIIEGIQTNPLYSDFSKSTPDITSYAFSSNGVFKVPYIGKYFISIDLVKANFQAFNYFNKGILNADSYKEFISNYVDSKYMQESKYIRQVIFGALNPKKQMLYEQVIRNKIYEYGLYKGILKACKIISFYNDEIIMEVDAEDFNTEFENKLITFEKEILTTLGFEVKCELFKLESILDRGFFSKRHLDNSYTLYCVPTMFYPQVYKYLENIPLESKDMEFFYEGCLCKMMEPIFKEKE